MSLHIGLFDMENVECHVQSDLSSHIEMTKCKGHNKCLFETHFSLDCNGVYMFIFWRIYRCTKQRDLQRLGWWSWLAHGDIYLSLMQPKYMANVCNKLPLMPPLPQQTNIILSTTILESLCTMLTNYVDDCGIPLVGNERRTNFKHKISSTKFANFFCRLHCLATNLVRLPITNFIPRL